MPHIPGHVKTAPSSFGILTPLYKFSHKTDKGIEINLPIGFAPSADIFNLPTADLKIYDEVVGFLPYITPWPAGSKKYLVTAANVIPLDLHEKSHKVIEEFKKVSTVKALDTLQKMSVGAKSLAERQILSSATQTIQYKSSSMYATIYCSKSGEDRTIDEIIEWMALYCVGAEVMGLTAYQSLQHDQKKTDSATKKNKG